MKIKPKDFRVRYGHKVDLQDRPTRIDPLCRSADAYGRLLQADVARPSALHNVLYVSNRFALLLIFQAMDAAGQGRALKRIDTPEKSWKVNQADKEERKSWLDSMTANEDCLTATATDDAPRNVVPADDTQNARLIESRIVLDTIENLNLAYPSTTDERRQELLTIRKSLVG